VTNQLKLVVVVVIIIMIISEQVSIRLTEHIRVYDVENLQRTMFRFLM